MYISNLCTLNRLSWLFWRKNKLDASYTLTFDQQGSLLDNIWHPVLTANCRRHFDAIIISLTTISKVLFMFVNPFLCRYENIATVFI